MENEDKLKRLVQLRDQKKQIEQEIETLRVDLIESTLKDVDKVSLDEYCFTKRTYRGWKYSEDIELIDKHLKEKRKEEQDSGVAEAVNGKTYIVITSPKSKPSSQDEPFKALPPQKIYEDFEAPY